MPWEGHFRPLVPLAHGLARRGHDVVFVAARDWAPAVEAEGFRLLSAGLSQAEGRARIAPLWAEVLRLPPEDRRPLSVRDDLRARARAGEAAGAGRRRADVGAGRD